MPRVCILDTSVLIELEKYPAEDIERLFRWIRAKYCRVYVSKVAFDEFTKKASGKERPDKIRTLEQWPLRLCPVQNKAKEIDLESERLYIHKGEADGYLQAKKLRNHKDPLCGHFDQVEFVVLDDDFLDAVEQREKNPPVILRDWKKWKRELLQVSSESFDEVE